MTTPTAADYAAAWEVLTTPDGCARHDVLLAVFDLARAVVDEAAGQVYDGDTTASALARLVALAAGAAEVAP